MAKKTSKKSSARKAAPQHSQNKNLLVLVAGLLIVVVGFLFFYKSNVQNVSAPVDASPTPADISVTFKCPSGIEIPATFNNSAGTVTFMLPGQEEMTLPHAVSADGAKYANADESMVFWNVGNSVMIMENGVTTYENCVTD